ncbi:hypothetical protein SAMN05428953_11894 [Mesorhizobium muleiense]|uniref:Transposase, Mutator family n=1 Tax=Mesorhizobium muleiense TaxID=1004279 RepID=A0A1G9DQC0_9HYPH|nr:hypothetical protein SAMN05428953_11894 [Mesorhizobium muleiense]
MTKRDVRLNRGELKALLLSDEDGFRRVLQTVVQEALEAEMTRRSGPRKASGRRSGLVTGPAITNASL